MSRLILDSSVRVGEKTLTFDTMDGKTRCDCGSSWTGGVRVNPLIGVSRWKKKERLILVKPTLQLHAQNVLHW